MTFVERVPTFDALQWTGSNIDDLVKAAKKYRGSVTWTVQILDKENSGENPAMVGALFLRSEPYRELIALPLNHYVVLGPIFGKNRNDAAVSVLPPDEFDARFTTKP